MITPDEIKDRTFEYTFRGFDPVQVRGFLADVASAWRAVIDGSDPADAHEAAPHRAREDEGAQQLTALADAVAEVLRAARVAAAEIEEDARLRADRLFRDAQEHAGALRREAEAERERIVTHAQAEVARQREALADEAAALEELLSDAAAKSSAMVEAARREAVEILMRARGRDERGSGLPVTEPTDDVPSPAPVPHWCAPAPPS